MTSTLDTSRTTHVLRNGVFLPALGLIVAAATQIDAGITTSAFRSASPASEDSLNFPWYGSLAGTIFTWWSFASLFLVIGFAAFARSRAVGTSRAGRTGSWAAALGAATIVVAEFLSAANADAMMSDPISKSIMALFATATVLIAAGLTFAGVATLRAGRWSGWRRFVPLANGVWAFVLVPIQFTTSLPIGVCVLAVLQVALGAALISEEA